MNLDGSVNDSDLTLVTAENRATFFANYPDTSRTQRLTFQNETYDVTTRGDGSFSIQKGDVVLTTDANGKFQMNALAHEILVSNTGEYLIHAIASGALSTKTTVKSIIVGAKN